MTSDYRFQQEVLFLKQHWIRSEVWNMGHELDDVDDVVWRFVQLYRNQFYVIQFSVNSYIAAVRWTALVQQ